MATLRIHTAQNVTLEYEAASIGDRLVAALIDLLILAAWFTAVILVVEKGLKIYGQLANWLFLGLLGVPLTFYHLACEVLFNGQSLGKKARHLRVVRLDGTAPRLGDYLLRWLLRLVDIGISGGSVGILTIALNGRGQRLGDLAAGTTVISLKPRQLGAELSSTLVPQGYQVVFPQAADLTDHDLAVLRQLLSRSLKRNNFLLLNETATKVKAMLHIQADIPDESFLRTVLRDHAHLATEREPVR